MRTLVGILDHDLDVLTELAFYHVVYPGTAKQTFKQRYLVQGFHRRKCTVCHPNQVSRHLELLFGYISSLIIIICSSQSFSIVNVTLYI